MQTARDEKFYKLKFVFSESGYSNGENLSLLKIGTIFNPKSARFILKSRLEWQKPAVRRRAAAAANVGN